VVNVPSVPEIITVNSEDLQTVIRDLLPSQNGFGSELQATNVITPIIDLTPTAEGSALRSDLQTALAFASITAFSITNANTTLANSAGFWRIKGVYYANNTNTGANGNADFRFTDGFSTKQFLRYLSGGDDTNTNNFDFVVFLRPGDSISINVGSGAQVDGSYRQIATGDGTLVNPSGYPL
jgi:hypothetical protein